MYLDESIKCLMLFQEELAEKGGEQKDAGLSLCIITGRLLAALHTYEPSLLSFIRYVVGWMVSGRGHRGSCRDRGPFSPSHPSFIY